MAMRQIEFFVMIDEAGDHVVAKSRDDLADAWDSDIGGTPAGSRVLALKLSVETGDTHLSAVVPADARAASMTVTPAE